MSEIRQIQVDGVNYDLVISEDEVSATSAAESAAEALSYKNQAATSATNAATSATAAATSATNAANSAEEASISAISAESAAYIAGGVSSITDPNEDGNLVVVPPNISDSGWAVRYDVDQTALLSASEQERARKNIAAGGTNPNLLDNPFFQVNQRQVANGVNINANGFVADRWQATGTTGASRNADGSITITNTMFHKIGVTVPVGKTVTISALYADGTIESDTFTWSGTTTIYLGSLNAVCYAGASPQQINFTAATKNVSALKLELGSVSTLANDTQPDYGMELAKCQRYFYRVSLTTQTDPFAVGIAYSGDLRFLLPIGKMRDTPTVATTSVSAIAIRGEGLSGATVTGLTVITQNELGVYLKATTSASLTSYKLYAMTMTSNPAIIDLSADL